MFLWVPDSIEGGGCFSVGEFLFHRGGQLSVDFYLATKNQVFKPM